MPLSSLRLRITISPPFASPALRCGSVEVYSLSCWPSVRSEGYHLGSSPSKFSSFESEWSYLIFPMVLGLFQVLRVLQGECDLILTESMSFPWVSDSFFRLSQGSVSLSSCWVLCLGPLVWSSSLLFLHDLHSLNPTMMESDTVYHQPISWGSNVFPVSDHHLLGMRMISCLFWISLPSAHPSVKVVFCREISGPCLSIPGPDHCLEQDFYQGKIHLIQWWNLWLHVHLFTDGVFFHRCDVFDVTSNPTSVDWPLVSVSQGSENLEQTGIP